MTDYKKIENYIIDHIDGEGYGVALSTPEEKIDFVMQCFSTEYDNKYNRAVYPNLTDRVADWLQGLPPCINIAFYNREILRLAVEWGSISEGATLKQKDRILDNYWRFMAWQLIKLSNRKGAK